MVRSALGTLKDGFSWHWFLFLRLGEGVNGCDWFSVAGRKSAAASGLERASNSSLEIATYETPARVPAGVVSVSVTTRGTVLVTFEAAREPVRMLTRAGCSFGAGAEEEIMA